MTESSNGCVSTLLETCLPETVNRDEKETMPSRQFLLSSAAGTLHFQTSHRPAAARQQLLKPRVEKEHNRSVLTAIQPGLEHTRYKRAWIKPLGIAGKGSFAGSCWVWGGHLKLRCVYRNRLCESRADVR